MAAKNNILRNPLTYIVVAGIVGYAYKDRLAHFLDTVRRKNVAPGQQLSLRMKILGVHPENDGTINMDLQIINSNSFPMSIKSIVGEVLINGHAIAAVKFYGNNIVPGNQEAIIPLMTRINSGKLIHVMPQLFRKGGGVLQLLADININDHAVPLKMTHTL